MMFLFQCAGLDGAGAAENCDDDSAGGDGRVVDGEGGWDGAFGKEAFAGPEGDGKNFQPQFVDQVVFEECLDKIPAPVNLYIRPVLHFQLLYFLYKIALDENGILPFQLFECS